MAGLEGDKDITFNDESTARITWKKISNLTFIEFEGKGKVSVKIKT